MLSLFHLSSYPSSRAWHSHMKLQRLSLTHWASQIELPACRASEIALLYSASRREPQTGLPSFRLTHWLDFHIESIGSILVFKLHIVTLTYEASHIEPHILILTHWTSHIEPHTSSLKYWASQVELPDAELQRLSLTDWASHIELPECWASEIDPHESSLTYWASQIVLQILILCIAQIPCWGSLIYPRIQAPQSDINIWSFRDWASHIEPHRSSFQNVELQRLILTNRASHIEPHRLCFKYWSSV
jgi:hypothetical protein